MKPDNFSYVIPNYLAGMAYPAGETTIEFLSSQGIAAVVNLTERPLRQEYLNRHGMESLFLPIPDFSAPTLRQIEAFVDFVDRFVRQKKGVVVHCRAGMGRTGTMLACYLAKQGYTAEESIQRIRSLRPGSIETEEQEDCVIAYEESLKKRQT